MKAASIQTTISEGKNFRVEKAWRKALQRDRILQKLDDDRMYAFQERHNERVSDLIVVCRKYNRSKIADIIGNPDENDLELVEAALYVAAEQHQISESVKKSRLTKTEKEYQNWLRNNNCSEKTDQNGRFFVIFSGMLLLMVGLLVSSPGFGIPETLFLLMKIGLSTSGVLLFIVASLV